MDGPDVRWEGVSHRQIVAWTSEGVGAKATEWLESRLQSTAEALSTTAELVNTVLRRVHGGEWAGSAASVAAEAMAALRDFDDALSHHSRTNVLAAAGQSGNASWARASVPDVVTPRTPSGGPLDVVHNTVDYHHQLDEAKNAEERARQVMREYESMTTDRIAALPRLTSAPRLTMVVDGAPETISAPDRAHPGGADRGEVGDLLPRGSESRHRAAVETGAAGTAPSDEPAHGGSRTSPGSAEPHPTPPTAATSTSSTTTAPAGVPRGSTGDLPRSATAPIGGPAGVLGGPGGSRPPSGSGQPAVGGVPVAAAPGTRGGVTGQAGRGGGAIAGPVGAAGASRPDEDKEHQRRYGMPGSEIFEPDHDDGVLRDPYRPGSYVAPASIGDEDDE